MRPTASRSLAALPLLLALLLLSPALPARAQDLPIDLSGSGEQAAPAKTAEPIPIASSDTEITGRLRGIFGSIEGLGQVTVTARDGVVKLGGTTLTSERKAQAEDISTRLAGVVTVENDIAVESRVGLRLQPLVARARDLLGRFVAFLPLLGVAILVVVFFWLLGRLLTRSTRVFRVVARNAFIEALIGQVVRLAFLLAGIIVAMNILEADALLGSILGAAGVLGLAIGFAVRDTIENYIASILLSIRQPFAPNDLVLIEGVEGHVAQLNSRATMLLTLDGNEVRIPNAIVYKAKITNYSRAPERRFDFEVGIGTENEIAPALAIALKALQGGPAILTDPKPAVVVDRLGDFNVILKAFGWIDQRHSDFMRARSEAIRRTKEALDDAGVSMPDPIQNVRPLDNGAPAPSAAPSSPEKPAVEPDSSDYEAITDTRADRTIERKVAETRAAGSDLLTPDAPRE